MSKVVTKASPDDVRFVAQHESPGGRAVTRAYRCPAGVVTIGHGFTMASKVFAAWWRGRHGRDLRLGDTITQEDADGLLRVMLDEEYGAAVAANAKPALQHHFGAAASMAFNCGTGALRWRWAAALRERRIGDAATLLRTTAVTANGRRLPGLVNRRKAEAMLLEHARYHTYSPAIVSAGAEEISWYQRELRRLGHDPGVVDGVRGPRTIAAVKAFQADNGLVVDGVVGPATRAALVRAVDAKRGVQGAAGSGAAGGAGAGADVVATAPADAAAAFAAGLQIAVFAVAAAALVYGAVWLYRNRGRVTGRRVPT